MDKEIRSHPFGESGKWRQPQGVWRYTRYTPYPDPKLPLFDLQRINVVGEYGGILRTIETHLWKAEKEDAYWDNKKITTEQQATDTYLEYNEMLKAP